MRDKPHSTLLLGLALLLVACVGPRALPAGPTPIPTLIPATEPSSPLNLVTTPSFTIQSYPARPPSAELGQPLYDQHCATCHGEDGRGSVPGARDFSDQDYVRGETPASFYAAVTEGRGEMPPFREALTSDERWDVVFYVWRFSTDAETLATGERVYDSDCAVCHGDDGTGEVLGASDFTDLRLVDNQAPRDFYLIVTQGKGSMPAWQGRLSQEERWAVIDYLRTFSYDPGLPVEAADDETETAAASCEDYLGQSNPFAWDDAQAIAAGQEIYGQSCAICHADDGSGGMPNIMDFTAPAAGAELRQESGEALCVIALGQDAMPGWQDALSLEQMWQVLTFIASLSQ